MPEQMTPTATEIAEEAAAMYPPKAPEQPVDPDPEKDGLTIGQTTADNFGDVLGI